MTRHSLLQEVGSELCLVNRPWYDVYLISPVEYSRDVLCPSVF